jgi:copper resistance protein C
MVQFGVRRVLQLRRAALAGLLSLSLLPAHAVLMRSLPSPNGTVKGPQVPIELSFNSKVDGKRSTLAAELPDHQTLKLAVQQSDSEKLVSKLEAAKPGAYLLRWQVLSVDGHITRGAISFQVK